MFIQVRNYQGKIIKLGYIFSQMIVPAPALQALPMWSGTPMGSDKNKHNGSDFVWCNLTPGTPISSYIWHRVGLVSPDVFPVQGCRTTTENIWRPLPFKLMDILSSRNHGWFFHFSAVQEKEDNFSMLKALLNQYNSLESLWELWVHNNYMAGTLWRQQ